MIRISLLMLLVLLGIQGFSQVEHNFKMDPENTDCHLIKNEDKTPDELISEITSRTFRYVQRINISRYRSPRSLYYYSCDGQSGYIIAVINESESVLFTDIQRTTWDEMLETRDILEYYNGQFLKNHSPFTGKPG
ncbi:hypothetical protein [Fulvivirga sedimenti]|uniref:Uncharacterized protein n=1 Tax=Fulvivirga sedimenti TaxID=2879465 RepID=A0A9X1L136_9BACT|nr:hypothetical protein [Fulvivirga sedimenti]MCA6075502.1 hypothetical protein [Fulvivirga sedimenti]MCA6076679.1 hypothetical protein [Fulvivirga sedimenti]MCA6077807.1 hypothetical protein [Fulvivirga sedimenti]